VALDSSHIVEVGVTSEKFFQRFTGGVNFGTIYSKGNQSVQYNISGLAAYPRERWEAQAGISSNLSTASGTSASTHNQLTLGAMHLLPWNNYFYAGFDGFLQSSEQGIAHQNYVGGGIGRYLKNTDRATITLLGGLAWQNTVYNPTIIPIATQNVATGVISTDVKLFKFNKTNLDLMPFCCRFFPKLAACMFPPTRPTTSRSPAASRGISRSTATGTLGRRATYLAATTGPRQG
jgi:hypothetical protein